MAGPGTKNMSAALNPFARLAPPSLRCHVLLAAKGETMFYRKNMGTKERVARLVAGGSMVACAFALVGISPMGWLLAGAGVIAGVTGLVGFCPACAMVGRGPVDGPSR